MNTEMRGLAAAPDLSSPDMMERIERAARENGWQFGRSGPAGAISLRAQGEWSDYDLSLTMQPEHDSIEVRCVFALAPPDERRVEVTKLADCLNRRFHRGVLELRIDEDHGLYTDWVPMAAACGAHGPELVEAMRAAVGTCDFLLFPAFHCVAWAEINAETALDRLNFGSASHRYH